MSDLFTQVPDNAITEPGIYDLTHEAYLADPVIEPSLNNSIAKLLVEQSPAHAWAAHPRFNREIDLDSASEDQDVGTAAHAIFLKGDASVELVDVKDWRTNAAKEARSEIQGRGHIALKKERYGAVARMVDRLERFRQETGAFTAGAAEQTVVWKDGPTWGRCKIDWLPDEFSAPLWDLKTISGSATLRKWTRQAFELGTDMQAAYYPRGVECVRGEPPEGMNFCVIESKPPYGLAVFAFSPASMEVAEAKVRYAIKTWEWCMADNRWPNYPVERQWVEPPVYVLREWEALTTTGAGLRQQIIANADNLAPKILEAGSFG